MAGSAFFTWALMLSGLIVLARYLSFSPLSALLVLLLLLFGLGGYRPGGGVEQFAPVYIESSVSGVQYGVAAVQGRRQYMEDMHQTAGFTPSQRDTARVGLTHFFAVYDGHGGKRAAQWAHAHLLANIVGELATVGASNEGHRLASDDASQAAATALDTATVNAFHKTDSEFLQQAASHGIPDGSTAVACLIQADGEMHAAAATRASGHAKRRLLVANLGDSRCVLVRNDGTALALSSDHKPNRPDERARVQAAGGQVIYAGCWRVQGDLAVSRAFGDAHLKPYGVSSTPELSAITLTPRDAFVVLASDGLWDVVDEQQCASSVLRASDTLSAARTLCDLAMTRGSMDNITVLIVAL